MSAVSVGSVVTEIQAQVAPVAAIGVAVLLLWVAIAAFHWIRQALDDYSRFDYEDEYTGPADPDEYERWTISSD